jgi:AcrR family transcriptional regulator
VRRPHCAPESAIAAAFEKPNCGAHLKRATAFSNLPIKNRTESKPVAMLSHSGCTGKWHDQMKEQVATRRRGAVLEEAILDAAWAELLAQGYSDFTIEGVAQRAGTSRTVLYRRWPNRLRLATAAVVHYIKANPISVPDMGNVRDEICLLLRKYADRTPPHAMRLFFEMNSDMAAAGDSFTSERFREDLLGEVIKRGIARGEIDEKRVTPRVIWAPFSLVLNLIMITGQEISDEAIEETVDQVFLPLVTPRSLKN